MSLDADRLRRALVLATGETRGVEELDSLCRHLDVVEEALAYILLRAGGFAGSAPLETALRQAIDRVPTASRASGRPLQDVDAVDAAAAEQALKIAIRAAIDQNLASSDTAVHLDNAARELAEIANPQQFDSHLRMRPPS